MIQHLKNQFKLESDTLDMYLQDVILDDMDLITKIAVDAIDYTVLINKCLESITSTLYGKPLDKVISNIKSLIENITFEPYGANRDMLVNDILEQDNIEYMVSEYNIYINMCILIQKYIYKENVNAYNYNKNDILNLPTYWIEIDHRNILKVLHVYTD